MCDSFCVALQIKFGTICCQRNFQVCKTFWRMARVFLLPWCCLYFHCNRAYAVDSLFVLGLVGSLLSQSSTYSGNTLEILRIMTNYQADDFFLEFLRWTCAYCGSSIHSKRRPMFIYAPYACGWYAFAHPGEGEYRTLPNLIFDFDWFGTSDTANAKQKTRSGNALDALFTRKLLTTGQELKPWYSRKMEQ